MWDLIAALDPRAPASTLCLRTLVVSFLISGNVFKKEFMEERVLFYAEISCDKRKVNDFCLLFATVVSSKACNHEKCGSAWLVSHLIMKEQSSLSSDLVL